MDLRAVMGAAADGLPATDITQLAYDNRLVEPGALFFCVRGAAADGHAFAPDAVGRGASALVVDHPLGDVPPDVPQVVVADVRAAMAPAAARFHGDPTRTLRTAGITGTNGKTTSAYLLRSVLEATGHRTGLLGTVATVVGGVESPAVRTTPEAIDLQRTFAAMLAAGDTHCAMEVSSHALELGRADAVHWAVAVFTNLSQDHLDFHPSMEAYFLAKRRLFTSAAEQGVPVVLNVDDAHGRRLAGEHPDAITVGIASPDAALRAEGLRIGLDGSRFTAAGVEVRLPLPGAFNVLNALGAAAAAHALGVEQADALRALDHIAPPPGRLEPVDEGQPFAVLVDYAHTPDGLENVLQAARGVAGPDGRVLVAFGAGGDRDRAKRPLMGAAAARHADVVVVTSDNPRSEDPAQIVAEVSAGAARDDVLEVVDRREAIGQVIGLARPGDVVVIAGKGHEQGQEGPGGVKVPFSDVEVAREALRAHLDG